MCRIDKIIVDMNGKDLLNYPAVHTLSMYPAEVIDWKKEQDMLASMEKERIAKQFPWKRKGYRKHIK